MLALLLLVTGVRANHANHAIAADNLAVTANFLYRRLYSHFSSFQSKRASASFRTEHDPGTGQVIGGQFHRNLVTGQDADVVHPHLARDMPEYDVSIFKLDPERRVRQRFKDLALHLDGIFLSHITQCLLVYQRDSALPLKLAFLSKLSYW